MVLSDILFDRSDCRFLLGERYAGREIRSIHLVASIHDLTHMEQDSLLFVTPSFFSQPFPLSLFFSLAIQADVAGVAFVGRPELCLSPSDRERLLCREIFVLSLPAGTPCVPRLQSVARPAEDLPARNAFRRELAELCAGPYTAQDVAVLLNRKIRHPVDLAVGRELHDLVQHNTLGIMNVTSVIQQNLEKILSEPRPQIYSYYNSKALVIRIGRLYAFLAVPLEARECLTDLEFFYIEEAIPYLTLALSRRVSPHSVLSVSDFYLSLLRGASAGDPLALREAASLLGIRHDLPRYVWILDHKQSLSEKVCAALSDTIASLFPGSFIHSLSNRLVIITAATQLHLLEQQPAVVLESCLSMVRTFYPQLSFRISISRCCPNLEHLKGAYTEAKFAMIIGPELDPGKNIYSYQTYILYHILCNSWGMPILNRVYVRYVIPLRDYDRDNGTELLPTLEQLASQAFHLARTAEALQIHRNTLYRRIQKIGSILDCDMSSTESHVLLYIALLIGRILAIFPQTESDVSWTI